MFCFNCGQQLVEGAKFCSACGTKIVGAVPSTPTPTPQPQSTTESVVTPQPNPQTKPEPTPQHTPEPVVTPKPAPQQVETKGATPKPKRNKNLITLIIILLVAGGIGIAMLIADEMHSDSSYTIESYDGTGSPEATFHGFMAAVQRQDTYAVSNYMSSSNRNRWDEDFYDMVIYSYEVISSNTSGREASVVARLNTSEGTTTRTFRFVKGNGKWVINN
jgi:uncharacterized membrane protein YvbJ